MDPAAYVQYRAWRSFFRSKPLKYRKYIDKIQSTGNTDVQMETGELKTLKFSKIEAKGLNFYILENMERGTNIKCYAEI